ncbi:type I DNA topoisomerase [Candidatus Neptunochlamydia vexilliferae]|uniref:DNA topoisomerase 1 n=1 Tax=Candidatus Neptunichlamydia vexilliferae TaxID=1651774 RepID=A0ABS0AY27_9BACT|nr:type I DNA topoisomerase [Candidatus Neptunochlamydia vexilliferae]MBF5059037.1 DNA topoisomerase 1 [Candidatus Neptunochlamydia vexilliferae]
MAKGKTLIIVESPTKVKTLKKFLGSSYHVESSVGHIRDLPSKGFGIDLENKFEPEYENLPDKKDVIAKLRKTAKECDTVYLSPDPDREGEAIAWHIAHILPKGPKVERVTFNAITKDAVSEALKHPRKIDQSLVNAQQARRLLDRMVGYKISPIIWKRIKRSSSGGSLSAGRVQSVALKLVVDREKEIEAFNPIEYWTISTTLQGDLKERSFVATLHSIGGKRIEKELVEGKDVVTVQSEIEAKKLVTQLKHSNFKIAKVEKKEKKRRPVPPFITSTLQQEASRHYGFAASRTMGIAQSLYEGVDLGSEGTEGLITYMRTDSVRVEMEAINAARTLINRAYGKEYLPSKPNFYTSKKSAQDAHEAIRPTNLTHPPDVIKSHLTPDQYKIYLLIWRRFLASQMNPAIYDTVSCDIETDKDLTLRATGSIIKFKGFLAVYQEREDVDDDKKDAEKLLPPLKEGQTLNLLEVEPTQSFTKPPPRFTEASLVKELEKSGIGRPSTYASIMNKIQGRAYTVKERLALKPTELGKIIAQMLETHFTMVMDIRFTARMEDQLDEIAENKQDWKEFLDKFWTKFVPVLEKAEKEAVVPKEMTDINCPKCGNKLQKIWSRDKYFYGCSHYPECKFTVSIEALEFKKEDYAENFDWDQPCSKCSSPMKIRFGRFGTFLGCTRYPDCNGIVNIPKKDEPLPDDLPKCPAIGCDGDIRQRKSRWGKPFFSCSNYPDCDVIANQVDELEIKYQNHPKTAYVKKVKKGAKKTAAKKKATKKKTTRKKAVGKPLSLSPELEAIIGAKEMSRTEVTKKVWEYIKAHDLQNPDNKRQIVPDKALAKVFGHSDPIDMMKLAGILSAHLT